jgi:hypothetical protein
MLRIPLPVATVLMAIWPSVVMVLHWPDYADPRVAVGVLAGTLLLAVGLCRLGPHGIGPATSLAACCAVLGLAWALGLQLADPYPDGSYWMNSWGVAVGLVLAFARPPEEPLALGVGLTLVYVIVAPEPLDDLQAVHYAPLTFGAAIPATVCAIALAATLRVSVTAVRAIRARADAAEQRVAVADAVQRERERRFARWESAIVPLLEDVACGRRSPRDPAVARESARLSRRLRAQLSAAPESLFESLLGPSIWRLQARGGDLVVRDLDVGYRLREDDRVRLSERIRALCDGDGVATVQVMLDAGPGDRATVVIAVDGLPPPDARDWAGALTVENPLLWWWDAELELDPAPALDQTPGRWPSSTAR